ncbi:MAG: MFS transporter [Thermoflexibacter sp.]|jgi:MFS family permease|nr:MFS transporter [Thermoflexibacter sp.]
MIIPELPDFLTKLGGAEYKGLIISLFTLTAGLSRPFSGKLADTIGRLPVMVLGVVVCVICALIYPILSTIWAFFLLRLVHGFSTGFTPTGTAAYLADIVPASRRGEAIGLHSLTGSIGNAIAPVIGSAIAQEYGLEAMFYISSLLSFVSALIFYNMKETLKTKEAFRFSLLNIQRHEIVESKVFPVAIAMILIEIAYGTALTLAPDKSVSLGIENKGLFFASMTTASLLTRFLAGRASDRYGRIGILKVSALIIFGSMVWTGAANNPVEFLLAGGLYGIGLGMGMPTLFAWTIDLCETQSVGKAIATTYIALEIGIGLGAFLSGWLMNISSSFFLPLAFSGVASGMAFIFLIFRKRFFPSLKR